MSSKFSLNSAVQQPPPVCRKPPDTPLLPIPPLPDRPLFAYIKGYWPFTFPPFDIVTHIEIYPTIVPYVWGGITKNLDRNVQIVAIYDPLTHLLDVELQMKHHGTTVNTITFHNMPVADEDRFGTRMAESEKALRPTHYQVQVYQ